MGMPRGSPSQAGTWRLTSSFSIHFRSNALSKIKVESSKIDSGGGADRSADSKISDAGAEVTDAEKENKMGTGGGAVTQAVGLRYPQGGAVCTCFFMRAHRGHARRREALPPLREELRGGRLVVPGA